MTTLSKCKKVQSDIVFYWKYNMKKIHYVNLSSSQERTNISGETFQPKTTRVEEEQRDSKQFSQTHQHVTLILSAAWILQFKLQSVVSTGPL